MAQFRISFCWPPAPHPSPISPTAQGSHAPSPELASPQSRPRRNSWSAPFDDAADSRLAPELAKFYEGWVDRLWPTLEKLPANRTALELTLVRRAHHHSICYPLNRLLAILAERQFKPKLVTGSLEQLYEPSHFDLALVRHGIGTATTLDAVRKQILPFG